MPGPDRPVMLIRTGFPLGPDDVWTAGAIAGLVGQEPMLLTTPGDHYAGAGRVRVVYAGRLNESFVEVTLEMPKGIAEEYGALLRPTCSVGYAPGADGSVMKLLEVGPPSAVPRVVSPEVEMLTTLAAEVEPHEPPMRVAIREALDEAFEAGDAWATFIHYPGHGEASPPSKYAVLCILLDGLGFVEEA